MQSVKKYLKLILWYLRGGYRPQAFWDRWAKIFMDDPWQVELHNEHIWFLEEVKKRKPTSILEIGCGFGRNLKFLLQHGYLQSHLAGMDISKEMIKRAKIFLGDKKVDLKVASVDKLPYKDNSYDLVFSHGVFMHIAPSDFYKSMTEVFRVARKYVIFMEQNSLGNEYTFIHDYKSLLKNYNGIIETYIHKKKERLDYIIIKKV